MTEQRTVQFRVFRYKQGRERPWYDTFDVTVTPRTTVLEALQFIRRVHDPSLMLRHSCHHASCGTCGMRINGQERLACITRVHDIAGERVTVEPLANLPIIGDLVVDMKAFYAKFTPMAMPLIRHSEFLPEAEPPEGVDTYTRLENCIECGLCVSVCPVAASDPLYLGPAALAAAWRVVQEPRGQNVPEILAQVDTAHGCWRCHIAMECSAVCPSHVDPGAAIMALRGTLIRQHLPWRRKPQGGDAHEPR